MSLATTASSVELGLFVDIQESWRCCWHKTTEPRGNAIAQISIFYNSRVVVILKRSVNFVFDVSPRVIGYTLFQ